MESKKDLVAIAKRENNPKRSFLVVNRLQGKHIPAVPAETLAMFQSLAAVCQKEYADTRVLVIGFAETATAIGVTVAVALGADYIQTTREDIAGAEYLYFSEEHSHATEQRLVKEGLEAAIARAERILFVEDEVTTGRTILNIIRLLRMQYPKACKFAVASLLNGMDETARMQYQEQNIPLHFLVRTHQADYEKEAQRDVAPGTYHVCTLKAACQGPNGAHSVERMQMWEECAQHYQELCLCGGINARCLVSARAYQDACSSLWQALSQELKLERFWRVLVLGTEEFMYPALFTAEKIQQLGLTVRFHATTRSPILVSSEKDYPLHTRYELCSLYDSERVTFVYDLDAYDVALVITDAQNREEKRIASLVHALRCAGSQRVLLVRWCWE